MKKLKPLLLALVFILLLPASSALAQSQEIIWWVEYFDNPQLKGNPARAIREAEINHDWGYNAPLEGVPADRFSVRWSTTTTFEAGQYTFSATVDDGVRIWVDGELIMDEWRVQSVRTFTTSDYLTAGEHTVQMAYFEDSGAAVAKMWWRKDSDQPPQPPEERPPHQKPPQHRPPGGPKPEPPAADHLLVDNTDPGFLWGGPLANRRDGMGGVQHGFFWTQNTVTQPENYGKWTPAFSRAGWYEVLVFIPDNKATTTNLRYRVLHNGERHDRIVDQSAYYNQWVNLGTYYFNGQNKGKEFILVYDNTREPIYSTYIAFDAVKLVPTRR